MSHNYIMAMILSTATLCVSCGNEISHAADRRNICNKSAKAVTNLCQDRARKERPT